MLKKISFITLLCAPLLSNAAIESMAYEAMSGESIDIKIKQSDAPYLANASDITLSISSGLDRKLKVVIKNGSGVVTHEQISAVININNLIVDAENSYYGKIMTFPAPTDGSYTIEVITLNLIGDTVDTENYQFQRDTLPPTASALSIQSYGGTTNSLTPADIWYTGYYSANKFTSTGISDSSSGVDKVELVSYTLLNGKTEYKRIRLNYDVEQKLAQFTFGSNSGFLPHGDNGDIVYGVEYQITDYAGNVYSTPMQRMFYDTIGARGLELIGVQIAGSSNTMAGKTGFEPYSSGMTVNMNPISIMYKIPVGEYKTNRRGGYGPSGQSEIITDQNDGNIYAIFTRPYNFKNTNYIKFRDQRSWNIASVRYNLKLSTDAPKSPVRTSTAEYLYSDIGWSSWYRWDIQNTAIPISILGSRQRVQPRTYVQKWSHSGYTCLIPVGETYCETTHAPVWDLSKSEAKYFHVGSTLSSEDGALYSEPGWASVSYNDKYYPIINAVTTTKDAIKASIEQPAAGSWFDHLRLRDTWLEDKLGNKVPAKLKLTRNGIYYEANWDLNSLDEGVYELSIVARERHGPTTRLDEVMQYISDKTPPTLEYSYDGSTTIPNVISNLREIGITLNDSISEVTVEKIKITSIEHGLDIILGYTVASTLNQGKIKTYNPELPRLFPSLKEGGTYTMTTIATDQYGNEIIRSVNFKYTPDNLIQLGTIKYLPVNVDLYDYQDNGIATLTSNVLILDDGRMATGLQIAIATLKSSATMAITINGVTLQPGESTQMLVDLGESGGKLNVPIHPAEKGMDGVSQILFEIPALSSMYD